MAEIDITKYSEMPVADLEARRAAITAKANGSHKNLELEELHELAAIMGVLRRKVSGPPKEKKAKKEKPAKVEIADLA